MPVWIVDDGPLDHLALVVTPKETASWPQNEFYVADETAAAARGRRKALLEDTSSPFRKFSIAGASQAFEILYEHLREPVAADKNLAEHQSIAWAMTEKDDAVFVAQDKGAAFLALAELGRGRAAHPTDLWLRLLEQGLVSSAQFEKLCELTRKSDQSRVPLRCSSSLPES